MIELDQYKNNYERIEYFTKKWRIERILKMTLSEYVQNRDESTFCHDLEKETDELGRISGLYSTKYGIWRRNIKTQFKTGDLLTDGTYAWRAKYGTTAKDAFNRIRDLIIEVVQNSQTKKFKEIDGIDLDLWLRWKVAFIYSDLQLIPIYKRETIRQVAKNLRHPNYKGARFSDLHQYIVSQKPEEQDFFEFYLQEFNVANQQTKRNYYIIGSKYRNQKGEYYSISRKMFAKGVISTGYLWNTDFKDLYGKPYPKIIKWINQKLDNSQDHFDEARRTLSYFLELNEGDIIAIKSEGMYGRLTIIAYAEVISKNGVIYQHDDDLGHTINVNFLETDLERKTGLSYGKTIHHIIPNQRKGHFEKIFGGYTSLEEEETEEEIQLKASRINEKSTTDGQRSGSKGGPVSKTHDKLQIAFAKYLDQKYTDYSVRTEERFIDIIRESETGIYFYEVKPFHSPYACIRAGIGQLLDYQFKYPSSKIPHLVIVGSERAQEKDLKFIQHLKKELTISFEYISFKIGQA